MSATKLPPIALVYLNLTTAEWMCAVKDCGAVYGFFEVAELGKMREAHAAHFRLCHPTMLVPKDRLVPECHCSGKGKGRRWCHPCRNVVVAHARKHGADSAHHTFGASRNSILAWMNPREPIWGLK